MRSFLLNGEIGRYTVARDVDKLARPSLAECLTPKRLRVALYVFGMLLFPLVSALAQSREIHVTQQYLNIPIGRKDSQRLVTITVNGTMKREFPVQLAQDAIDYWIFIDVNEFTGQTITLSGSGSQSALDRIYQDSSIHGAATLYHEINRPQFHFTVKRGWSNDINGPIFYKGQYHLFWQAFPFGVIWDTGFMYWGHAVSTDLVHWRELPPAMRLDKLGSPWSGSSLVDHHNDGGWGKDALVLVYTAFDRASKKEVQCIAYSTDNGATFTRFEGNPVLDSNAEVGTDQTRDPKVFWYEPAKHFVMVLFEKDGMSFYTSSNLRNWTKKSHFKGLFECPDFFEMPVDGDASHMKWVIHGGSSSYFIGKFDGDTFTPESPELHYAEGKNTKGEDLLYAAQSFAEMPHNRRIQMAWGRIEHPDMPFTQIMLFPTEFNLTTTPDGLRLLASPVSEIEGLHKKEHAWSSLTYNEANQKLHLIPPGPLQVKAQIALKDADALTIRYQGNDLITLHPKDLNQGQGSVELLIDKTVAEIFIDGGTRYIVRQLNPSTNEAGLEFIFAGKERPLRHLEVYEMKSMWQ